MNHFICLQIECPAPGAVEKGNIGLLSEQVAARVQIWIPLTTNNLDLGVSYRINQAKRAIFVWTNIDYEFIYNRQDGFYAFDNRVIKPDCIRGNGESGNFQLFLTLFCTFFPCVELFYDIF